MPGQKYEYDVFLSHAIEDKIAIANELYEKLKAEGIKVWFSGSEFRYGDSLELAIYRGLHKSRFGIILLTKNYISKSGGLPEFQQFIAERQQDEEVLLPIFHGLKPYEIYKEFSLSTMQGLSSDGGMDNLLGKLIPKIRTVEYEV